MRILLVYDPAESEFENPFVSTLKTALEQNGAFADWHVHNFWNINQKYDVIFFQWPEAIFGFRRISEEQVSRVASQIEYWKSHGSIIAYMRHNERPHTDNTVAMSRLYGLIESSCDVMVHLGGRSRDEFLAQHGDSHARHVVSAIHLYPTIDRDISKNQARRQLSIPPEASVILCFGAFRNDEERWLVLKAVQQLEIKGKYLLAPRFFPSRLRRRNPFGFAWNIIRRLHFLPYGRFFSHPLVSNSDLPFYFAAADVVMIQRVRILNSGNLPIGFYFGKVVVGPDCGNVGEILRKTGNPVFEPDKLQSVVRALEVGFVESAEGLGIKNRQYADDQWDALSLAKRLLLDFMTARERGYNGV